MNDKIIKLIKLANNNPNEHEANLAARKACKMLEEEGLKETPKPNFNSPNQQSTYRPYDDPFYYSKDWFRGFRQQAESEANRRRKEEQSRAQQTDQQRHRDYYNESYYDPFRDIYKTYKPPSKQTEKRNLKCKTCGHTKLTPFVGPVEAFECNECTWSAFEKNKL